MTMTSKQGPPPEAQAFKIEVLSRSEQLAPVAALYRKDSKTLGFFPFGAFEDHARKRQVFVAQTATGECAGYLLYRVAKNRASIVHLCVADACRGKGVGAALIDRLKLETKHLAGIGLYCRRDFEAHDKWPRYGFVAKNAKRGRGRDQAELTFYWIDHNHPDLFSRAEQEHDEDRLVVVMDSNVFFDLHERSTPESDDSKALLEPWLQDTVELCVTSEMFNDINKAPTDVIRRTSRAFATKYRELKTDGTAVKSVEKRLAELLTASVCLRDESDIRHLAHTIAAGERYFVTRDADLIERAEPLYDIYGVSVLHPSALINELDTLQREEEYRPARLAGSPHRDSLLKAEMLPAVIGAFRFHEEKQSELEKTLNHFLAKPKDVECKISLDHKGNPLVLCATTCRSPTNPEVLSLRVSRDPLATTVARHVLHSALEDAARNAAGSVSVSDPNLGSSLVLALQELGFVFSGLKWVKYVGGGILEAEDLRSCVTKQSQQISDSELCIRTIRTLDDYATRPESGLAAQIEHLLWPAKVKGALIPTYIIPIQPRWAGHFFDVELSSQMLFGLKTELHLGIEGVYYRSPRGPRISAPGRILWYVSQGEEKDGAMAIKACSRLEEVAIGAAKDLYRRFRRLGVYERKSVIATAGGNPEGVVMALRFAMTERFKTAVPLAWLNAVGLKGNFPGPREIEAEQFEKIYAKGCNLG